MQALWLAGASERDVAQWQSLIRQVVDKAIRGLHVEQGFKHDGALAQFGGNRGMRGDKIVERNIGGLLTATILDVDCHELKKQTWPTLYRRLGKVVFEQGGAAFPCLLKLVAEFIDDPHRFGRHWSRRRFSGHTSRSVG
jgi:hypothetical protein